MIFEQGYFMDAEGAVSNYRDYTSRKYDNLANDLIEICGLKEDDVVVDFGCATGALIKALLDRGFFNIYGTDISYWAVEYGKNTYQLGDHIQYHNLELLSRPKDFVFLLDVLEHVPSMDEVVRILSLAKSGLRKSIIVRIPISKYEGADFVLPVSRNDKTHVQCHCRNVWSSIFKSLYLVPSYLNGKSIYTSEGVMAVKLIREESV